MNANDNQKTGAEAAIEAALDEPRLIADAGIDARITAIVEPVAADLGYRLVRVRLGNVNGLTLQIMAEKTDGTFSIDDCEKLSRAVSPVLDHEDPVSGHYNLEVSSPGIDRPLVRRSDFERWLGHVAKIELRVMTDGRKRFKGRIADIGDSELFLRRDDPTAGPDEGLHIAWPAIGDAKLVLSDDLIREALRRDKALRSANGVEDDAEDKSN